MKERLLELKEKIMQNKKKAAATGIAVLLLIGAGGYGIASLADQDGGEAVETVKTEKNTVGKEAVKKEGTEKKSAKEVSCDKEKDEKKASDSKKETKKTEAAAREEKKEAGQKAETKAVNTDRTSGTAEKTNTPVSNSSPDGGSVNTETEKPQPAPAPQPEGKPEQTSKPEPPVHVHEYSIPVTTQKWVVDQPAWTETVNEPVYEMVEHTICSSCGADISGWAVQHLEESLDCGGYYSEWRQEQTGTNTYTVEHPEQGHYETVTTGHKCSCGAVQ